MALPTPRFHLSTLAAAFGLALLAAALALLPLPWTLLLVTAIAGALCLLRWPWLTWPATAAALPVASGLYLGPLPATELLLAGSLFLWLLAGAARRTLRLAPHPLSAPLALFVGVLWLATLGALDLAEAVKEMVKWVEFGVVLLLVPAMMNARDARWLVAALLSAAMAQALLGLYQFVFRIGPEHFVLFDRYMRASGSFGQPNPFAGYLGLTLPVAAALTLWAIPRALRSPAAATAALWVGAAALLTGAGMVASWSRGSWLGAAAGVLVVLLAYSRRTALLVGAAILLALSGALVGLINPALAPAALTARLADLPAYVGAGNVLDQPVTDENFAVLERLAHWLAAVRMFSTAPWLGVGPGNYSIVYPEVRLPLWEEPLGHAHNIYLNLLAESGLVGLAAFLMLWGSAAVWVGRQTYPGAPADDGWRRALAVGVLGVLAHLAVHSLFDNLFVQGIYLHVAFWFAALAAAGPARAGSSITSAVGK
ncbi:MAG TPA: O-antigen ligase family protein [Caldilineaceae bacterium]|nr:O-antigen ligase family protein [Caldilineaceae bacterium]